jgi:hypothetical protein
MKPEYTTYEIRTFKEYQDIILDIAPEQFILYRGQPIDKPLLPKIARYKVENPESIEQEMLNEFRRRSLHLMDSHPGNTWDWLALAQHHGMATRPLIALWFSMSSFSEQVPEYTVVWGFKPPKNDITDSDKTGDPFRPGGTKIFKPNHIIKRISAQFAWFTIHCHDDKNKFIPFEETPEYGHRLFKIKVHKKCFAECKRWLHNFGINSAVMYPDVDGLAKHVEWMFLGGDQ